MDSLPKLPGIDFADQRIKKRYHVPQCFTYRNGYKFPKPLKGGIGGGPHSEQSIAYVSREDASMYDPVLTYGRVKPLATPPFRPHYVIFDKMVLTFKAFFKQSIPESEIEHYRIRHVNIIYFLEDDTITVMEPKVTNCGFPQGKFLRRGKVAKNISGECYSWKDFNIGIDIELNGFVFHITDCDIFTKDFLTAQGVELNVAESSPTDPVNANRQIADFCRKKFKKPKCDDKLRRLIEYQGKVLRFDCVLDETDRPKGDVITFKLLYKLENDTISIKELEENQEGRDRFPLFLKPRKVPKNWKRRPVDFASAYLEVSDHEVDEYYSPKDLMIGDTIFIYGRKFLLLDCDKFTRKYYSDIIKKPQKERLTLKYPEQIQKKRPIPEYLGLGTPEDSLSSCFGLRPKPPKKDVIKYLVNINRSLRYSAVLDSAHPEDSIRKFILCLSLSDDTITILEPPIKNSGILGGKFLAAKRIPIPNCDPKMPVYYGPKDFIIDSILTINHHRFRITGCDVYVYNYMKEFPELFSKDGILSVCKHLLLQGNLKDEIKAAILADIGSDETKKNIESGEEQQPVSEIEQCLRSIELHSKVEHEQLSPDTPFKIIEQTGKRDEDDCGYRVRPLTTGLKKVEFQEPI